ncbi:hypothetical protein BU15DRAFT_81110 [Melanogaster broomeanus]|nr:hypothetical protein BU15DRAFT_81110 [Melanogaster broomeanus]
MSSPRLRVPIAPARVSHLPDVERDACGWDLVGPLAPVLQPNPIHPTLQRFGEQMETIATICASDYKTQEDRPWDTTHRQPPCNCMEAASQQLPLSHLAIRPQRFPTFSCLSPVLSLLPPRARMSPPSKSFPASLPSLQGSQTPALAAPAPARASSRQVLVSQSSPTFREPLQPMVPSLFAALL